LGGAGCGPLHFKRFLISLSGAGKQQEAELFSLVFVVVGVSICHLASREGKERKGKERKKS
jgi:hypothetical protein